MSIMNTAIILVIAFAVLLTVWYLYVGCNNKQTRYNALLRERINARWPHLNQWFRLRDHVIFYGDVPGMETLRDILNHCGEDVDAQFKTVSKMDQLLYIVRMCVVKQLNENPAMFVDKFLMVKYGEDRHDLTVVSVRTVYPDLVITESANGSLGFASTNNIPLFTDKEREYFKM